MQIVPVSRRFRQNVLQFVFFFFHAVPLSNDPGYWFQKMCKRTQNDRGNFQRRFMIMSKNARLKEVLSDYQKVSIPNTADTHVYDCNSKCRWKIPPSFSRDSWKFPSSFTDHAKSKTIHAVLPQSLNDDEKFCHQCYTNAKNVNILSKIISQTGCKWLPW